MKKKYLLRVTEEAVMNPNYQWGRGGRIAVYEKDKEYAIEEYRFFVPVDMFEDFKKAFDGKETDYPVRVDMNWSL